MTFFPFQAPTPAESRLLHSGAKAASPAAGWSADAISVY